MTQQDNAVVIPIPGTADATGTFRSLGTLRSNEVVQKSGKSASVNGQGLPAPGRREAPKQAEVDNIVKKLNATSLSIGRDLRFQVNLQTGKSVIQVLDSDTGEVIRQIPAEDASSYLLSEGKLALRMFDELA